MDSIIKNVLLFGPPFIDILDMEICPGNTVFVSNEAIDNYDYLWKPSDGVNDPFISEPLIFTPDTTLTVLPLLIAHQAAAIPTHSELPLIHIQLLKFV